MTLILLPFLLGSIALGCGQCEENADDAFFGDKDVEEEPFDDDDDNDDITDDDDTTDDDDDDDNDNDDEPYFETIETGSFEYTSIALDDEANVHVAYIDTVPADFKYASNATETWKAENVGSAHQAHSATSVKVDGSGHVHACFSSNSGNGELLYAYSDGDIWTLYPVDSIQTLYCSLDLEDSDALHMAYYDLDEGEVEYQAPGFVKATVATATMDASFGTLSLALDNSGAAHIVYADNSDDGYLRYATNSSGDWAEQSLVNASVNSAFLQIDTDGKAHIAYNNLTDTQILYITNVTTTWVAQVVKGSLGILSGHVCLSLDENNKAHISYYDGQQDALSYASNLSGTWSISEFTDSAATPYGTFTSIAADESGHVHISFISGDALRYANIPSGYSSK